MVALLAEWIGLDAGREIHQCFYRNIILIILSETDIIWG